MSVGSAAATQVRMSCICSLRPSLGRGDRQEREKNLESIRQGCRDRKVKVGHFFRNTALFSLLPVVCVAVAQQRENLLRRKRASFQVPIPTRQFLLSCPTNRSFHRIQHVLIRRATYHQNTSRISLFANTCPLHTNGSPTTNCPTCPKSPAFDSLVGVSRLSCCLAVLNAQPTRSKHSGHRASKRHVSLRCEEQ